jgi:hypothetical protein
MAADVLGEIEAGGAGRPGRPGASGGAA